MQSLTKTFLLATKQFVVIKPIQKHSIRSISSFCPLMTMAQTSQQAQKKPFSRLPTAVTPVHYELTLKPDLVKFTFEGLARINVNVHQATQKIVLNSAELVIDQKEATLAYLSADTQGKRCRFSMTFVVKVCFFQLSPCLHWIIVKKMKPLHLVLPNL